MSSSTTNYEELDRLRQLAVALKRNRLLELRYAFDPFHPTSRPTPKQDEILRGMRDIIFSWVMGGNQSGKSQTGARVVAWFFKRDHPYIDIDKLWPDEPMVILVVGRVNNQVEELWDKKIRPFLDTSEWKENRQGGSLQYVQNPRNGSKIIFCSHQNPAEAAQKLYSYSAHLVWMDELSDSINIFEELQRRVMAKRGRMICTFTPKIRAEAVRQFIESPSPKSRIYKISMLDNPIYKGREQEQLDEINKLPENLRETILYGDWYVGERAVFTFDPKEHIEEPLGYSAAWSHVVSVDPAASGLTGLTVWAAPYDNATRWYCVKAKYMKPQAPSDMILEVEKEIEGLTVIYRVADVHEVWWRTQASKMKIHYRGCEHKRDRKKELIAQLNQALVTGRVRLTKAAADLAAELGSAQWSETVEDRIANASSYHLADTAQYFVDLIPKFKTPEVVYSSFEAQLRAANKARIAKEGTSKKKTWKIVGKRSQAWTR